MLWFDRFLLIDSVVDEVMREMLHLEGFHNALVLLVLVERRWQVHDIFLLLGGYLFVC